ncbi:MAG TPA: 4-hydroxy-tetrahydrodipicolinate reductase [Alkalispirochaeta sp.]|nr:4-hydroxy-tetrahydrodipicolinate reductase [Alkalispirochaeta sp.]
MKIAVVGYGRMGQEIARAARERDHTVTVRVDPAAESADFPTVASAVAAGALDSSTTVIEFALPEGLGENMAAYIQAGCSVVIGTTGWDAQREEILAPARSAGIGVVWGSNFSVGANMFARITEYAATLAARADGYDPALVELHHRGKQDSPSGTALMLAEKVLHAERAKTSIQTETLHRRIQPEELHVASARIGSIPGTHTAYFDSFADTVELTHRARNRHGFAVGAVKAAEWIVTTGGVHSVGSFFDHLFAG